MGKHLQILREIKENTKRLESCERHKFNDERIPPRNKHKCLNCGGVLDGREVMAYIAGYEAGGGDCNDIYPGWRGNQEPDATETYKTPQ